MSFNGAECRWVVNKTNPEYVDYISRMASVSPIFAQVLINRGLKTSGQIDSFLNPDISRLSDPFELPDLKIAVDRIIHAKKSGERVLVHGDYDADGLTATAIMVEGLRDLGIDAHYFIPDRMEHGYGFGKAGVDKAKEIRATLVITVDCGITSFEAVSDAKSCGIDVIITDHHEPVRNGDVILPEALAVINPKLCHAISPLPPYFNLSGAGVAFKVVQGLFGNNIGDVHKFLDLAAIGTAADVVPAIDDNRIIIKEGVKLIQSGQRPGIKALKEAAGIKTDFFKMSFLYYTLIPRINAAGRIAAATDVVRLLTTDSAAEAEALSQWLNGLNVKRQQIEESVYKEAEQMLDPADINRGVIVLASEGWHPGVVGIVASKLADKYYRPSIVLSIKDGTARGSCRSIPPFDIHNGLAECRNVLKRFGGHKQAAGLSLSVEMIEQFRIMLSGLVTSMLSQEDFIPVLQIDASVRLSDVSTELIDELAGLEPFGYSNDEPLLGAKNLEVIQPRIVGNNHLKMHVKQNGRRVDSIGFDFGGLLNIVEDNSAIDAVFMPMINEWDGGRYLQLNIRAIRPSQ